LTRRAIIDGHGLQPTLAGILARMLVLADRPDRLPPAVEIATQLHAEYVPPHAAE